MQIIKSFKMWHLISAPLSIRNKQLVSSPVYIMMDDINLSLPLLVGCSTGPKLFILNDIK